MSDSYNFGNGTYFDRVANKGAVNGRETRDYNEYRNWGGPSLDSGVANPKSSEQLMRESIALQQEQVKPAIASYEASIPETQARFQTERTRLGGESARLEDRYKSLIGEIKRNQGVAETRQTRSTGSEMARRGINQESGVYGEEMTQALNPITESYTGQIKGTGLEQEDMLAKIRDMISGLSGQETDAVRAVRNAIAQLQAGAGQAGIAQGMQSYQNEIQNQLAQGQLTIQQANQALAERQQQLAQQQYNQITLPESQVSIQNTLDTIANRNKTGSTISGLQTNMGNTQLSQKPATPVFNNAIQRSTQIANYKR